MWQDQEILIITQQGERISTKQVCACVKEGLSFGVVDLKLQSSAWGIIHLGIGRVGPSIFPTQESAMQAAEMMEGLGDWDEALKVCNDLGGKVPFYKEARQVVQKCGGKYLQDIKAFIRFHQDKPNGVQLH